MASFPDASPPGVLLSILRRIPPSPLVMYYTYILKSLKSGKFYFGHSENLSERLKTHNKGKVTYTRPFRPWVIKNYNY